MMFRLTDLTRDTTLTTGTGSVLLTNDVLELGQRLSDALSDGDTTFYCIRHRSTNEWETGRGTYVASTGRLARTEVFNSSNGDALVNFSAGTKDVLVTLPASQVILTAGDVEGPAVSVNTEVALFDGTTGKLLIGGGLLGSAAFAATGDFAAAAHSHSFASITSKPTTLAGYGITDAQPLSANLTTWAGLTPSANAQSLVTAANYAAMRGLLDLEAGTDFYSVSGADAIFALKSGHLGQFAATTSAQLRGVISDETGTGALVFATSPVFPLHISVGVNGNNTGQVTIHGGTSGEVIITTAAAAGTHTIKLPTADGSTGQFLKTDGAGQWGWASQSGLANVVDDLTPQLGGNLDLNGFVITGLEIGTNIQAWDADLDTWATLTPSANAQSLVTAANYAAMRGLLDLEAGTDFYSIAAADALLDEKAPLVPMRGVQWGLRTANNTIDADHDIDIAIGVAADLTTGALFQLASARTKRIDVAWAVGNNQGGLDTGTVAVDTWYYLHLIKRTDTGVVDALFSVSATAPTMPANYDLACRIGAVLTNASANIIAYVQRGDMFLWKSERLDFDSNFTTTQTDTTISVPVVSVEALIIVTIALTASEGVRVWSPLINSHVPASGSYNANPVALPFTASDSEGDSRTFVEVVTDSGAVRWDADNTVAGAIITRGWRDLALHGKG